MARTVDAEIEGLKITAVREMTKDEAKKQGWGFNMHGAPKVIILENGTKIFPSCDEEGNGAGCMFGEDKAGTAFYL